MLHHGSRLGPWVTFSKQLSLTVAKKEKNEATLEGEQTNLGVERETTRDGEVYRDIAAHVHSRCLPTLQIPERALFARFNVSFKRGEHYRNWSINPLPLTGVLWIANSCWFHVEVLGTTCHKSSVVHKSQSPRVLLTESSSFYTNPREQLLNKSKRAASIQIQ